MIEPKLRSEVYDDDLIAVCEKIRGSYLTSSYDHRALLPPLEHFSMKDVLLDEEFRVTYACFKRAVAMAIQPKTIIEFGVGMGITAMAFMDACPNSSYIGYDNDQDHKSLQVKPTMYVAGLMKLKNYKCVMHSVNTQDGLAIQPADLIHIDACHLYGCTYNDTVLALRGNCEWILVDDCRYSSIAAAVLAAVKDIFPGSTHWTYFEHTWTGNILIHRKKGG
jgi:predicted O-methyltransferase YrrM